MTSKTNRLRSLAGLPMITEQSAPKCSNEKVLRILKKMLKVFDEKVKSTKNRQERTKLSYAAEHLDSAIMFIKHEKNDQAKNEIYSVSAFAELVSTILSPSEKATMAEFINGRQPEAMPSRALFTESADEGQPEYLEQYWVILSIIKKIKQTLNNGLVMDKKYKTTLSELAAKLKNIADFLKKGDKDFAKELFSNLSPDSLKLYNDMVKKNKADVKTMSGLFENKTEKSTDEEDDDKKDSKKDDKPNDSEESDIDVQDEDDKKIDIESDKEADDEDEDTSVECPVCDKEFHYDDLIEHLQKCLAAKIKSAEAPVDDGDDGDDDEPKSKLTESAKTKPADAAVVKSLTDLVKDLDKQAKIAEGKDEHKAKFLKTASSAIGNLAQILTDNKEDKFQTAQVFLQSVMGPIVQLIPQPAYMYIINGGEQSLSSKFKNKISQMKFI